MSDDKRNSRTDRAGRAMVLYTRFCLWWNLPRVAMIVAIYFGMYAARWWYWLIAPAFIGWLYFDIKVLYPREIDYRQRQSETIRGIESDVQEIKQMLYEIKEEKDESSS